MAQLYNAAEEAGNRNYEVVLIGLDRGDAKHHKYSKKMPWPTLKFSENETNMVTKIDPSVFIPHMVITDAEGKILKKGSSPSMKMLQKIAK